MPPRPLPKPAEPSTAIMRRKALGTLPQTETGMRFICINSAAVNGGTLQPDRMLTAPGWTSGITKEVFEKKSKEQIISTYEFDLPKAIKELEVKQFHSPTPEWLHFVTACRSGVEAGHNFDLVTGPVANENG